MWQAELIWDSRPVEVATHLDKHWFLKIISININDGALVYRLGHEIFILGRGVRFPWALLKCFVNS